MSSTNSDYSTNSDTNSSQNINNYSDELIAELLEQTIYILDNNYSSDSTCTSDYDYPDETDTENSAENSE